MKVQKINIPGNSLVCKYLPADYSDAYACEYISDQQISPDQLLTAFWTIQPKWVKILFKLRNRLVRPFGLETGDKKTGTLSDQSENESVVLLKDKHLNAWLSIYMEETGNNKKRVILTTVVQFNYWLGNIYFFFIAPFHHLIVKSVLKYSLTKLISETAPMDL